MAYLPAPNWSAELWPVTPARGHVALVDQPARPADGLWNFGVVVVVLGAPRVLVGVRASRWRRGTAPLGLAGAAAESPSRPSPYTLTLLLSKPGSSPRLPPCRRSGGRWSARRCRRPSGSRSGSAGRRVDPGLVSSFVVVEDREVRSPSAGRTLAVLPTRGRPDRAGRRRGRPSLFRRRRAGSAAPGRRTRGTSTRGW